MDDRRKVSRRSFLGQVVGGAVGLGALSMVGAEGAEAEELQNCNDNDTGRGADPLGRGRRCRRGRVRTGVSDSDTGPQADEPNYGIRGGCSDSDRGSNADQRGQGRSCGSAAGRTGLTDNDSGPNRDQPQYGRGRGRSRNCSDSDTGRNADGIGRGRRC